MTQPQSPRIWYFSDYESDSTFSNILKYEGFEVIVLNQSSATIRAIKDGKLPDMMLLDVEYPLEVVKSLRKRKIEAPCIPFSFVEEINREVTRQLKDAEFKVSEILGYNPWEAIMDHNRVQALKAEIAQSKIPRRGGSLERLDGGGGGEGRG